MKTTPYSIAATCIASRRVLARYYQLGEAPDFDSFLLPTEAALGSGGRVILDESPETDEVFVGLQFGTCLANNFESELRFNNTISLNSLAVVAEETSHLQLILDACLFDKQLLRLKLETLGEIDRFLVLMHWNELDEPVKVKSRWKNLHELCDEFFEGERFSENVDPVYFDAEQLAFIHLKKAFKRHWDNSHFDFSHISSEAQGYLTDLRWRILQIKNESPGAESHFKFQRSA